MPPKSAHLRMRSGGHRPHPPQPQEAAAPASLVHDPAFDFLSLVLSPVTCDPLQSGAPHSEAAAAVPPSPTSSSDPFAFLALVPSQVVLPPSQQGQGSGDSMRSIPAVASKSPSFPRPSQLATLPAHMAAGDSAVTFMAMDPSMQSGQGADATTVRSEHGLHALDEVCDRWPYH
jgi:hypothetical protein